MGKNLELNLSIEKVESYQKLAELHGQSLEEWVSDSLELIARQQERYAQQQAANAARLDKFNTRYQRG